MTAPVYPMSRRVVNILVAFAALLALASAAPIGLFPEHSLQVDISEHELATARALDSLSAPVYTSTETYTDPSSRHARREEILAQWSSFLMDNVALTHSARARAARGAPSLSSHPRPFANDPPPPLDSAWVPSDAAASFLDSAASTSISASAASAVSASAASRLEAGSALGLDAELGVGASSSLGASLAMAARAGSMPEPTPLKGSMPPPGVGSQVKLGEGPDTPTSSIGVGTGEVAEAKGAEPTHGYFIQTPECDAAMRVWLEMCAFSSPQGLKSLYWHAKRDPFFPPMQPSTMDPKGVAAEAPVAQLDPNTGALKVVGVMSSIDDLSPANYIGNMIANELAEVDLGENSYEMQRQRALAAGAAGQIKPDS